MSQLDVLRAVRARVPRARFVKLEITDETADDESQILVFTDNLVFPFIVSDDEWADPAPLVEQIVSGVNGEVT